MTYCKLQKLYTDIYLSFSPAPHAKPSSSYARLKQFLRCCSLACYAWELLCLVHTLAIQQALTCLIRVQNQRVMATCTTQVAITSISFISIRVLWYHQFKSTCQTFVWNLSDKHLIQLNLSLRHCNYVLLFHTFLLPRKKNVYICRTLHYP